MKIVVALGGNALERPDQRGTFREQKMNVRVASRQLAELVEAGHRLIVCHGNGPQVGALAIQGAATDEVPQQPLHVLGAMTQGEVGYAIQQELGNLLRAASRVTPVVAVVTQTVVDANDPAFEDPSKPIGPLYGAAAAKRLTAEKGFVMKKVTKGGGRQFRRVVPSPEPLRIVEAELIAGLSEGGSIVVAAGGGGIPVVAGENGVLSGVDAVIDKDLAAERLGEAVDAEVLMILTNVDSAMLNYGRSGEKRLGTIGVSEAKKHLADGQFGEGSMAPKVLACIRFLEWGGRLGVIAALDKGKSALAGDSGTRIVRD